MTMNNNEQEKEKSAIIYYFVNVSNNDCREKNTYQYLATFAG